MEIRSQNRATLDFFRATLDTPNEKGIIVPFSFHQIIPRPVDQIEIPLRVEWAIKNWGAWSDHLTCVGVIDYVDWILVYYNCPYEPPLFWAQTVARKLGLLVELQYLMEFGWAQFTVLPDGTTSSLALDPPSLNVSEEEKAVSLFEEA